MTGWSRETPAEVQGWLRRGVGPLGGISEMESVEQANPAGATPSMAARRRLLLVEDNPGDSRLTLEALKDAGEGRFEVVAVETLGAALAHLRERGADVILLDLSLPDSYGIETFQRVRDAAPGAALIVLSGLDDEDLATRTVQMGGQDYLVKGDFEGRLLVRAIGYALQRKRLENDLRRANQELKATQLQLMQAEKMESLGRLAAGVAHEVRNPLARILLASEYLEGGIAPEDANIPRVIAEIKESALRANEIISGMVDFAAARRPDLHEININGVIERAARLVSHEVTRAKAELVRELADDLPLVQVDPGKMEQVFLNVFVNALHAMKQSPRRRLTVRSASGILAEVARNEGARTRNHLRANDRVVTVEVEDEGCGIPGDALGKVFDPFFTTKATGEGTGLGLTVVRKIIDLHKGLITIENREGGGVRATIILKAAAPAME